MTIRQLFAMILATFTVLALMASPASATKSLRSRQIPSNDSLNDGAVDSEPTASLVEAKSAFDLDELLEEVEPMVRRALQEDNDNDNDIDNGDIDINDDEVEEKIGSLARGAFIAIMVAAGVVLCGCLLLFFCCCC